MKPEDVLAQCLAEVERGETPAEAAARHPEIPELEAWLQAALELRRGRDFDMRPEARRRIESRLRQQAPRAAAVRRAPAPRIGLRWLAPVLATVALVLSAFGVTAASAASLPGDPLYGVKRTVEVVQLGLTPSSGQAALHIQHAYRRLDELEALAERGTSDYDAQLADDLAAESEAALAAAEEAPADEQTALLEDVVSLTEREKAVLERVKADAPPQAQAGLERALEAVQRHRDRAQDRGMPPGQSGSPDNPEPCPTNPAGHPKCKP